MPSPQCFQSVWWRLAVRSPKTALKLGWTKQSRITWSLLWASDSQHWGYPLPVPRFVFLHHTAAVCTTPAQGSHSSASVFSIPLCSPNVPTVQDRQMKIPVKARVSSSKHLEPPKYCCMPRLINLAPLLAITRSPYFVVLTGVPKSWNCACHL